MGQISITVYLAREKNENKTLNLHTGKEQGRICITLLKKRNIFQTYSETTVQSKIEGN